MTDPLLAARLRDVLSDETLAHVYDRFQQAETAAEGFAVQRDCLLSVLLPLLSSLLEEREREIRERLANYRAWMAGGDPHIAMNFKTMLARFDAAMGNE